MDLDFDCYMVGLLKRSNCVAEHTRREPKLALRLFLLAVLQFKINLFVPGAGWPLIQRNERLRAVVSLLFGIEKPTACRVSFS